MPQDPLDDLPIRCYPVLRGLLAAKHNREIARECGYSLHTVEKYASEIYAILGCNGRADLIARALHGDFGDLNKLGEVSV